MSLSPANWCSPLNPKNNCDPKMVGGHFVCTPMNDATRLLFKSIQRACNDYLKLSGKAPIITVDGSLGPLTVTAVISIIGTSFGMTCDSIAESSPEILAKLNEALAAKRAEGVEPGKLPGLPASVAPVDHKQNLLIPGLILLGVAAIIVLSKGSH